MYKDKTTGLLMDGTQFVRSKVQEKYDQLQQRRRVALGKERELNAYCLVLIAGNLMCIG